LLHLYSEFKNEYISLRIKAASDETLLNAKILDALHHRGSCNNCLQEAQLMLTNLRDAFIGQSRSSNIVPSHNVRYSVLLCNSNFVFKTRRFYDIPLQKCRDLENRFKGSIKVIGNVTV